MHGSDLLASWWNDLASRWSWSDPVLLLGLVTVVVTAFIPVLLWRLGSKQTRLDRSLNESQAESLQRQERLSRSQRRDALSEIVDRSSDPTHLGILWREVKAFEGENREFLLAVFRSNVAVALPGSSRGVKVDDDLDDLSVNHYVEGLERRYASGEVGFAYTGLLDFISLARSRGVRLEPSKIVRLVTGPTAGYQHPGHGFYRDLVGVLPETAAGLLGAVESIDWVHGGLRLNVLTGTLLAIKDIDLGRTGRGYSSREDSSAAVRSSVPSALASLLHRDNLRSFERWSRDGSTEPVSATVAWLIRAVGWLADTDDHLAMRMVQNLAPAIESIPAADRGWGIDDKDVQQGFAWIEEKQPTLWSLYGESLQAAAAGVGPWGSDDTTKLPDSDVVEFRSTTSRK